MTRTNAPLPPGKEKTQQKKQAEEKKFFWDL